MRELSGQTSCLPISAPSFPEPACANYQAHAALRWRPEPLAPLCLTDLPRLHRVYASALARSPQPEILALALDADGWRVAEIFLPMRSAAIYAWWSLVSQRLGTDLVNRLMLLRFDHSLSLRPSLEDLQLIAHLGPMVGRDEGELADIVLLGREQIFSFAECGLLQPIRPSHGMKLQLHPDECCLHEEVVQEIELLNVKIDVVL